MMKRQRGMTLLEITVAAGLMSVVFLVASKFLSSGITAYRMSEQVVNLQEAGASAMREFEYSTRAAESLINAESDELSYYRYYDDDAAAPTLVRLFGDSGVLKVGKTEPVGTLPNVIYPAENEEIDLLIKDVVNLDSLFTYYDDQGRELIPPINPQAVKMIKLEMVLDRDNTQPPAAIVQTTKVHLRNMKTNL